MKSAECSLTARSFQLNENLVKCTPKIHSEADGHFKSYLGVNKIIFDYLQVERDVQLDSTVVQGPGRLLDVKPEYDWTPLNWYVNPDCPDNVINQQPSSVIADLMGVMEHIITEGEEETYQSEIQYRNAQSEFRLLMKSAECSLTARSFQLDDTLIKCTPKIHSEADGHFKSYFAVNKIIFDYLQGERDIQLNSTVVQALGRLLDIKLEYD